MGVKRLSTSSGLLTDTRYRSMLAGYGDFGALQRIGYYAASGSTTSFSFTNIPQTYQDLMLVAYARTSYAGQTLWGISTGFNGISTTGWSGTYLIGNGSSASSSRSTTSSPTYSMGLNYPAANATSGVFGATTFHILNYKTSNYKTVLTRNVNDSNGSGQTELEAFLWQNTNPITQIDVGASGNLVAGSTWELFGVKASNA